MSFRLPDDTASISKEILNLHYFRLIMSERGLSVNHRIQIMPSGYIPMIVSLWTGALWHDRFAQDPVNSLSGRGGQG